MLFASLFQESSKEKKEFLDSGRVRIKENPLLPYRNIISRIAPLNPVFHPLSLKEVSRAIQATATRWEVKRSLSQPTQYYKNMKRLPQLVRVLTLLAALIKKIRVNKIDYTLKGEQTINW